MEKTNTVTQEHIDNIFGNAIKDVRTIFDKCTVMVCKLKNGFILVESSSCVDPTNYNFELGIKLCEKKIKDKLWELEGYLLQDKGVNK